MFALCSGGCIPSELPGAFVTDAGPYRKLEVRFRTAPGTRGVRFILDTIQASPYTEGHVTYDDCSLREADSPAETARGQEGKAAPREANQPR